MKVCIRPVKIYSYSLLSTAGGLITLFGHGKDRKKHFLSSLPSSSLCQRIRARNLKLSINSSIDFCLSKEVFILFQGLGSFGNRVVFAKPVAGTDTLATIAKELR
jgi:hypothetical protein